MHSDPRVWDKARNAMACHVGARRHEQGDRGTRGPTHAVVALLTGKKRATNHVVFLTT